MSLKIHKIWFVLWYGMLMALKYETSEISRVSLTDIHLGRHQKDSSPQQFLKDFSFFCAVLGTFGVSSQIMWAKSLKILDHVGVG